MHIDEGFTLFTEEMGVRKSILLQQPFERLRMSSDDGVRMMFLDFGSPEAEIVSWNFQFQGLFYLLYSDIVAVDMRIYFSFFADLFRIL